MNGKKLRIIVFLIFYFISLTLLLSFIGLIIAAKNGAMDGKL